MLAKLRPRLTYANVVSTLCLCLVVGGGSAYAANTVFSTDIVDGEVKNPDVGANAIGPAKIADNSLSATEFKTNSLGSRVVTALTGDDIADGAITSPKVLDDTQSGGGLAAGDLAANSVGQSEIQTDGVNATEIANDSIDSGEILDFGLSNQDIGVLFAEVTSAGAVARSSGGVIATNIATGGYVVDFGRKVDDCTAVATIGPDGTGTGISGEISVADRSGDNEDVHVDTNNSAGAGTNRPFRLVVVC